MRIKKIKGSLWIETSLFSIHKGKYGIWFRIFGYGLALSNPNCQATFSERNGFAKYVKLGNYRIHLLIPWEKLRKAK